MRHFAAVALLLLSCTHERVYNPLPKAPRDTAPITRDVSGGTAPGGTVRARDGHDVDLATLWGKKKVVVVFYMGHWCPHCQKQLGDLEARGKELADLGADVVAISTDSPDDAGALHDRLGLHFDLYSDPELHVIQSWGVADFDQNIARPSTFIVAPGGGILYRHIGQNQTDRPSVDELVKALQNES